MKEEIDIKWNRNFCVFSLRLPLGTYWGHRLWSLISQQLLEFFKRLKISDSWDKLYKMKSTCKNQGGHPLCP